jgi:hypothetical protein
MCAPCLVGHVSVRLGDVCKKKITHSRFVHMHPLAARHASALPMIALQLIESLEDDVWRRVRPNGSPPSAWRGVGKQKGVLEQ